MSLESELIFPGFVPVQGGLVSFTDSKTMEFHPSRIARSRFERSFHGFLERCQPVSVADNKVYRGMPVPASDGMGIISNGM